MIRTKSARSAVHEAERLAGGATVRACRFAPADGVEEVHLCVTPGDGGDFDRQLGDLEAAHAEGLEQLGLPESSAVFRRFFLSDAANQEPRLLGHAIAQSRPDNPVAISIVEQPPLPEGRIALWSYFLHDRRRGIVKERRPGGVLVTTGNTSQLWLTDSTRFAAGDAAGPRSQTRAGFRAVARELATLGATLKDHLVRTWVFVHDIDRHYRDMVAARHDLLLREGLTARTHYVASTGIAGRRADPGRIVQLEAYAVPSLRPGQVRYLSADRYLGPTDAYGVTFERGVRIDHGDRAHLILSGTASIDRSGKTVHPNDIAAQTDRSFRNIRALLADGGADFADLVQMIVYLRDPADRCFVAPFLRERFADLPYVIVRAPVCRPGWLIEVECWAATPGGTPEWGRL